MPAECCHKPVRRHKPRRFQFSNYVALPPSEAFRIEYWQLEEAKIRRRPPEKELSRQICLVVGGGNGVGRETVLLAAQRGAHIVVADKDLQAARTVATEAQKIGGEKLRWPRALIFVTGSQFGKR